MSSSIEFSQCELYKVRNLSDTLSMIPRTLPSRSYSADPDGARIELLAKWMNRLISRNLFREICSEIEGQPMKGSHLQ